MSIEWAAGLFEGEGYIRKPNKKHTYEVAVKMTDLDVLQKMQDLFGGSVKPSHSAHKPIWTWRLTKKQAVREFLIKMLPHFGERRSHQALNVLDWIEAA